jgi:succinate dehydrogenase / fumarate reductase cytochrome b subunit
MNEKAIDKPLLTSERPLSPHLGIYRWQLTMALSILHRITGAALAVGTVVLVAWLWAAAYDEKCFANIHDFFSGWFGKILLMGWTFAFYFHFWNGIRHLFWDMGKGFTIPVAYRTGWTVIGASFIFTVITWINLLTATGASQ